MGVVVAVGEGGEKSWKKSSVIRIEVGIKKVTSRFVMIGSETNGCEVAGVSSSSFWTCSGI